MTTTPIFATPENAETAFYEALENADLDAMMNVWSDDEEVVCVHPGGPRLAGFDSVRESWRQIFSGGPSMRFHLSELQTLRSIRVAIHSVHENIVVAGQTQPLSPIVATNVYLLTERGWRMLVHHASPAPGQVVAGDGSVPTVLH